MAERGEGLYRASEFAGRAGVTVRTLHHYDRLGLLKPSGRTTGGYRLYGKRDLARLQQIVTLKFIGLPLKQIKDLLDRKALDLASTLEMQREVMRQKRRQAETALEAIEQAERLLAAGEEPGWEVLKRIVEVIEMSNNMEWTSKYYGEEAKGKIAQRNRENPGLAEQGQRDWAALIAEVELAVEEGVDPASERAQQLAARWQKLIEAFTGGDPQVEEGLKKLYADQANWPSTFKKPYSDEVGGFICKAQGERR